MKKIIFALAFLSPLAASAKKSTETNSAHPAKMPRESLLELELIESQVASINREIELHSDQIKALQQHGQTLITQHSAIYARYGMGPNDNVNADGTINHAPPAPAEQKKPETKPADAKPASAPAPSAAPDAKSAVKK